MNRINPKKYKAILTISTISELHFILNLKESDSLATSKMIAYSIKAMNINNSDTNAKTEIPVKVSKSGIIA